LPAIAIQRGDIYWVDLSGATGAEIDHKVRPAVVIQNDIGNQYGPTTIVAPLSGRAGGKLYPTEVRLDPTDVSVTAGDTGLKKSSKVKLEQIRTVDKVRLRARVGKVSQKKMVEIDKAIRISLNV
jgi:mRNA interferase MazF